VRLARSISGLPARGRSVGVRTFSSLRLHNYRLWFIGQTISQSGSWMQSLAQSWLVYQLTGSALDLGITAGLQFAPVLVFGTIGGLVAGRVNKRIALLVTQSAFLLQSAVLSVLLFTGVARLWMVWVLAAIYGLINVVDNPTRQIFVMEMVGREDLANAVALNSVIVNASRIAGPAVAGVLILAVGLAWTFAVNAATFVAVIAALLAMRSAELYRSAPVKRARGQIRAGLRYAWGTWELRVPLLMMAVVGTLSYNFSVIMPLLAGKVFHHGAGTLSALTVAMGVGALGGGLFTAARRRPGYRLLVIVALVFGLCTIAVALAPTLIVALAVLVPMGAASVSFIATGNSLLQLHSTGAMRGRVMGLWAIVFLGSTPIGGPLTGFLAAHLGTRATLAIGGGAAVLAAGGAALVLRRIRAEQEAEALAGLTPTGDECDGSATRRPGEPLPAGSAVAACRERSAAGERHTAGEPLTAGAYRRPTPGPSR
jgi:MFS family permease